MGVRNGRYLQSGSPTPGHITAIKPSGRFAKSVHGEETGQIHGDGWGNVATSSYAAGSRDETFIPIWMRAPLDGGFLTIPRLGVCSNRIRPQLWVSDRNSTLIKQVRDASIHVSWHH